MKKINYLLAIAALAFTACQKEPALHSVLPVPANAMQQTLTLTLQNSDYQKLPSTNYASTAFSFKNGTDAQAGIATILNTEYAAAANKSTAAITYTQSPASFTEADSVIKDDSYTLTAADYLLLPGNKYTDFTIAQVLQWLPYKFPSVPNGTLKLLTWTIYPTATASSPVMPYSFLYVNGAWQAIYTVQPAQYTTLGIGKYDEFTTAFTNLPQTLGALVNTDVTVTDTVKTGDIIYVSYNYYVSSTADYQRVQPLEYNGSKFVAPYSFPVTINFAKTNGTWAYVQPLPVIAHTLTTADITLITGSGTATGASTSLLTNLGSYGDFESAWTPAELDAAFILVLKADYTTPVTNTNYQVIYKAYIGGGDVNTTYTFQWNGTAWVAQQ
ncbi:hypothetical protein [Mucilaginibacter sp.]